MSQEIHNNQKVEPGEVVNPGDLAIQKAFSVGLGVLIVIIVVVFCTWLVSGFYKVENGEQAIEYFLGKIKPYNESNMRTEGSYWSLPFPFTKVIKLQIKKEISLRLEVAPDGMGQETDTSSDPLVKGQRNYYITKDQNLIHLGWDITFRIKKLDYLIENFYEEGDINKGLGNDQPWVNNSRNLIIQVSKGIILEECSQHQAFDLLTGKNVLNQTIKHRLQIALDEMHSGLEITSLTLVQVVPPASVKMSFFQVLASKEKKKQEITESNKKKEEIIISIENEVKKIQLTGINEAAELAQSIKAEAMRVQTISNIYKDNPTGLKNYLKQLYTEIVSMAVAEKRIEFIQKPENATFKTSVFLPTSKNESEPVK